MLPDAQGKRKDCGRKPRSECGVRNSADCRVLRARKLGRSWIGAGPQASFCLVEILKRFKILKSAKGGEIDDCRCYCLSPKRLLVSKIDAPIDVRESQ